MNKKKFLISILGLNKLEATKACIESVRRCSEPGSYWLTLTNNGSTDGTKEYFDSLKCESVIVTHNENNLGFIGPNNDEFGRAKFVGIPYFICLNNDTEVSPHWLDYLAAPLDLDPNGALSGPGFYGLKDDMHGTDSRAGEYLEGSCLCAKVELVSRYGPLFANYLTFIYGDDSDVSLRMREKGHTIYHTPFALRHPRCTTVKQSPEVLAKCSAAQEKNHTVLKKRWRHYLVTRKMGDPIVLKRHIACGDTLLLTPVVRALKESNPLSPIYIETRCPEVFRHNPHFFTAVEPGGALWGSNHIIIDLEMAYENRKEVHIIDAYADAVREQVPALGPVDHRTEMFPTYEDVKWAIDLKVDNRFGPRVAVMHIDHGGWPGKNWPKERFAEVATHLVHDGWHVVLVGSQLPPGRFDGLDLTGQTTMMQLAALLKVSQLFIGGDSFPMHVAVAMGCPTIGIFGVTSSKYILAKGAAPAIGLDADPNVVGTGERHQIAGSRCTITTDECIKSVTVEQVIEAITEVGSTTAP